MRIEVEGKQERDSSTRKRETLWHAWPVVVESSKLRKQQARHLVRGEGRRSRQEGGRSSTFPSTTTHESL